MDEEGKTQEVNQTAQYATTVTTFKNESLLPVSPFHPMLVLKTPLRQTTTDATGRAAKRYES